MPHHQEVPEYNLISAFGSARELLVKIRDWIDAELEKLPAPSQAANMNAKSNDNRMECQDRHLPFVMTPLQKAIWNALDGQAHTKQSLANIVCKGDGSRLYKNGGLKEFMEEDLIQNKRGVGYYRVDAPPPELVPGNQR